MRHHFIPLLAALLLDCASAGETITVSCGKTSIAQCDTVSVTISGGSGGYVVDADRLAGQDPIGLVNLPASCSSGSCSWQNNIAAGTSFRIRAIDSNGQWGYSQDISVCGSSGSCDPIVQGSPGSAGCGAPAPAVAPPAPVPVPVPALAQPSPVVPPHPAPCDVCGGDEPVTTTITNLNCSRDPNNPGCTGAGGGVAVPDNDPGTTVPDCSVDGPCDSAGDLIMLPFKAARFLYEELLLETLLAVGMTYWALI